MLHAFTYFFDFSLGLLVSPHVISWPLRYHRIPKPKKCKWYGSSKQGVIKTACELNILNGMSPTKFDPEGTLRLNEAVKIACVIHALYTGQADPLQPGTGKHWADPYLAYAEANGILQKDEFTNYDRPATRSEMAHIFAKSLPEDGLKKINTILSINDVERDDLSPVPYAADIFKLYRAGVLAGEPKTHDFRPDSTITRAETAAIVARLALPETREKFDNFLHRGFYTDIPGFTLTNTRTGKTLSPGQRPYEELTAFVEGFTVIEQKNMISTVLKTASSPKSQTRMTKITYVFPITSTMKILAAFLLAGSQRTLLITSTSVGFESDAAKQSYRKNTRKLEILLYATILQNQHIPSSLRSIFLRYFHRPLW